MYYKHNSLILPPFEWNEKFFNDSENNRVIAITQSVQCTRWRVCGSQTNNTYCLRRTCMIFYVHGYVIHNCLLGKLFRGDVGTTKRARLSRYIAKRTSQRTYMRTKRWMGFISVSITLLVLFLWRFAIHLIVCWCWWPLYNMRKALFILQSDTLEHPP